MKRMVVALMVAGLFVAYGCAPKATADECKAACAKQAELAKPAAPAGDDPVAKVEAEFATQIAEAQKPIDEAVAKLDAEYTKKLSKAKGKAKDKLTAELTNKKEAKTTALKAKLDEVTKAKDEAVKAAADAKAKAEEAVKTAADQAITACTDACVAGGMSQAMAVCQAGAADAAAFAACQ